MKEPIPVAIEGKEIKTFTPEDFSAVVGEDLSPRLTQRIKDLGIKYVDLSDKERDDCIRVGIKVLMDPMLEASGAHRLGRWEEGWGDNLKAFQEKGQEGLVPAYFQNDDIVRWRQEFIKPLEKGFDYNVLSIILDWLFEKYASDAGTIYEFGCGTGHHLLRARQFNASAKIYGLDWAEASQKIIAEMVSQGVAHDTFGKRFDFFNPDESFALDPKSVVYTVGALEQVGEKHDKFLDYILKNRPVVCFHAEPIGELLDESNLVDFMAKQYYKKRNYLARFIEKLKEMENDGKIEIKKMQRSFLGGNLFTEYMIVVWSPKSLE